MANDRHVLPLKRVIVNLVEHGIANVPAEDVFALVGLLSWQRQVAGEHANAAAVELPLGVLIARAYELAVFEPAGPHFLDDELIPLCLQGRRALVLLTAAHDLHALDVGVEPDVRHDAALLGDPLEVCQERVAGRPGCGEIRGQGVALAVGQVVGPILGLQLGRAVGLVHPGGAPYAEHAVKDDKVLLPALDEEHRHAQTQMPSADDDLRVAVQ
mmetsp:Transcript_53928/g.153655  ORF Transcript_53928/g.153655 Transcript_53928/m.153655 type:complete len:214 (+) Transcript_53928:1089-1730(+)